MKTGYDKVKEFTKNGIFNKKAARKSLKKGKFTLIELLVVVAIIGILAAMLLPVLGKARASARESTMLTNMKQFNLAQIQYRDSDDTKQFLWNRMVGPKIGVDYGPLKNEGFIEDLMEDKFRKLKLSEDPMIQTMFIPNDADFHSNEKGLLYFNFKSKESNGTSVMDLATFNDKFGYDVPEDTEYAVVGVGKDGFLDTDDPKKDFVMIKRRDNENNERWKGE
ncbi:type II secretion system GspH family protein [Candidatus Woesearchaeota archaeon]|nr:type II secretion system GspH family protein [Candidatus Woesearchaeota archaeon]